MARRTDMTGTTLPDAASPPQAALSMAPPRAIEGEDPAESDEAAGLHRKPRFHDNRIPAFLLSTIVHTLLLVFLALMTYRGRIGDATTWLASQGDPVPVLNLKTIENSDRRTFNDAALVEQPINVTISPWAPSTITSPIAETDRESIDPTLLELAGSQGASTTRPPLMQLPGGGLGGRTPEGRIELGKKYGATKESEQAVDDALAWLAAHQRPNGSWSFNLALDPCGGQCRNGKKRGTETPTPTTGATGLALLAFLGAGHTHHRDGPYRETVRRGIYYLRDVAAEAEYGYDWQQGSMYGHGIALMALGEALTMSDEGNGGDSDLFDLVARGTLFTAVAQHDNGSWGYVPGSPGDTTLTGWQVLSLVAAKRNRIALRTHTLPAAKEFLWSTCTDQDYWFGYKKPPGEPTTTAIGLTLMMYLGESPRYTPFYMALTDLAERGPTLTNVYHDYYGTLALHHSRHRDWEQWNQKVRNHLVATQAKSGHEKGSWHFKDRWGDIGGRLYTTAMCTMMLEVYYRYLPLYGSIEEFPL